MTLISCDPVLLVVSLGFWFGAVVFWELHSRWMYNLEVQQAEDFRRWGRMTWNRRDRQRRNRVARRAGRRAEEFAGPTVPDDPWRE